MYSCFTCIFLFYKNVLVYLQKYFLIFIYKLQGEIVLSFAFHFQKSWFILYSRGGNWSLVFLNLKLNTLDKKPKILTRWNTSSGFLAGVGGALELSPCLVYLIWPKRRFCWSSKKHFWYYSNSRLHCSSIARIKPSKWILI